MEEDAYLAGAYSGFSIRGGGGNDSRYLLKRGCIFYVNILLLLLLLQLSFRRINSPTRSVLRMFNKGSGLIPDIYYEKG